jgi:hypothetical protein
MSTTKKQGEALHGDVLANILSYLPWTDVMKCRVASPEWRDAALSTPVQELIVRTQDVARNLASLAAAMPYLRKLKFLLGPPWANFLVDDEMLGLARGFHQLTSLMMSRTALRTCAPPHIMQLHNLETLDLSYSTFLVWNLADLSATPRLKNMLCPLNKELTGDLSCLQFLSQTLSILDINSCSRVTGDFHTLASFPLLRRLVLFGTRVTGDVRKIGLTDFPCLKGVQLGEHVYGGKTINRIVDVPEVMEAWLRFETRNPGIFKRIVNWFELRPGAQERYQGFIHGRFAPPLRVEVVWCGPRCGWRWTNRLQEGHCDIQWINGAPRPNDTGVTMSMPEIWQ